MGCVSSKTEEDPRKKPNGAVDKDEVAMQRRRLSVAPNHVGDISEDQKRQLEEANAASAKAEEAKQQPNGAASPIGALTDKESESRGNLKSVALSKKGYVPYNRNKVNQDREIVKFALQNNPAISLFGVMDGHGEFGHFVADFVKKSLPTHLANQPNLYSETPKAIIKAVKDLTDELSGTNINVAFSGTTAVFCVKVNNKLYVANIGDSRCVLGRIGPSGKVEALGLSSDQKPEVPEEKARILRAGGRVEPLPGPPGEDCGPPRVWLAEVDVPGLAMSRSIGDEVSQTVGVISVPEIREHQISDNDLFVLWASDGVWEFISNQEAVELVYKHQDDLDAGVEELVKEASNRWTKEEEVIDDITCVAIQFTKK